MKYHIIVCYCIWTVKLQNFSVTVTEKHRLRVFESRVLKNILGSKSDKVVQPRRKLLNQEPHNFCASPHTTLYTNQAELHERGHVTL